MRLLIADDEPFSLKLLAATLRAGGHDVIACSNGHQAWDLLTGPDAPSLALLNWEMPGLEGIEICRRIRSRTDSPYVYLILVTGRCRPEDVVAGLEGGADDFVTKPYDVATLNARIRVGERILALQSALRERVLQLGQALAAVKTLEGLLPICMHCKRIRSEGDHWHRIEAYISERTNASFTHGLCLDCLERHYPEDGEEESRAGPERSAADLPVMDAPRVHRGSDRGSRSGSGPRARPSSAAREAPPRTVEGIELPAGGASVDSRESRVESRPQASRLLD